MEELGNYRALFEAVAQEFLKHAPMATHMLSKISQWTDKVAGSANLRKIAKQCSEMKATVGPLQADFVKALFSSASEVSRSMGFTTFEKHYEPEILGAISSCISRLEAMTELSCPEADSLLDVGGALATMLAKSTGASERQSLSVLADAAALQTALRKLTAAAAAAATPPGSTEYDCNHHLLTDLYSKAATLATRLKNVEGEWALATGIVEEALGVARARIDTIMKINIESLTNARQNLLEVITIGDVKCAEWKKHLASDTFEAMRLLAQDTLLQVDGERLSVTMPPFVAALQRADSMAQKFDSETGADEVQQCNAFHYEVGTMEHEAMILSAFDEYAGDAWKSRKVLLGIKKEPLSSAVVQ